MKNLKALFTLAATLAAATLWGDTETVNGYTWTYRIVGNGAEIYKRDYIGQDQNGKAVYGGTVAISPNPIGSVTIPATLGGKPVTSIGECAFSYCSGLTSVTIPETVSSIGSRAFCRCSGLTSVTIPDSVMSIGASAFASCSYYDYGISRDYGLTSVTIGNGVTNIGSGAFGECRALKSLTMGNSVQTIGAGAFVTCYALTSFTIPASVTSIGKDAFKDCYRLFGSTGNPYGSDYKYGLLDGWIVGPDYLSDGTLCLEDIRGVADGAFTGCDELRQITIRGAVPIIGQGAFDECPNLSCVKVENALPPHIFLEMEVARFEVPEKIAAYMRTLTDAEVVGIEGDEISAIEIGRDWVSVSAIRAENDMQVNMSFDGLDLTDSKTTVSLRLFARDGGEAVTNFTFHSAITNGAILAAVLTDFDFDGYDGYSVSVTNSLFNGTHDFGRQVIPDETDVVGDTGSDIYSDAGYDEWGQWHGSGLNASSTSGVIRVWYGGDEMYEQGQPGEVGILAERYILPEGAPGSLYAPIPSIYNIVEKVWDDEWNYHYEEYTVDWWGGWVDNQWLREEHQYPLDYYHTWPAGNGGEDCRSSWETTLIVPAWIKTHWVELFFGDKLFISYEGLGSYEEDYLTVDDGDYFMRVFESQLQYQAYSYSGYDYNLGVYREYYAREIPLEVEDFSSSRSRSIITSDGYYIRRINRIDMRDLSYFYAYYDSDTGKCYYYDYETGQEYYCTFGEYCERMANAFIEYDRDGNIVATSPVQYDDNGAPLPKFGPATDDVAYSFSSALIPYNITFVDELNAVNTNATTYTIKDCFDFAPPAEFGGWDFLGWDVSGVYHQTGDITVTAQWSRSDRQVTFDVGAHGSRTGGGELEQTVVWGEAAVPPVIEADYGWVFTGWDTDISRVTESMTVTALYVRAPLSPQEATGLDKVWTTGGDAEWFTEWTEDAHDGTNHLHSGAIGNGQESWIETVVTNTGVVSFWWKASSEAYRGIAYDKLIFMVDGEIPESVPPIGGEVDWTNVTFVVEGDGPHALRWTYRKDTSDSDGEDCAWLDDVQYLREVHVTFVDGGATDGDAPVSLTVAEGAEITLPGQGSLAWPKHRFIGWRTGDDVLAAGTAYALGYDDVAFTAEWEEKRVAAPSIEVAAWYDTERTTVSMSCETAGAMIRYTLDGSTPTAASPIYAGAFNLAGSATIRAVAVLDDWFDSEIVSAVSVRAPWTPDECLNATGMVFRTGGGAEWTRDRTVAHDGDTAMRSGGIGDGQESWIETTVTGAGTLTFWWKVSSEAYKGTLYDLARLTVDGVVATQDIGGEVNWRCETVTITTGGAHVVRWSYVKDSLNSNGEDCAWLDEVTWTPAASADPIPAIPTDATPESVTNAIADANFTDEAGVMAAIDGSATNYLAFKTWAQGVAGGEAAVVASDYAAVSYLLGAEALFEGEPEITISGLAVGGPRIVAAGNDGEEAVVTPMSVTVVVKDGGEIALVDEEKVAGMLEATGDLGDWDGAAKLALSVTGAASNPDGSMTFTVVIGDGTATRAFLRIRR